MAGPATPTGLREVAYSGTAGGIAWTRPATTGLRYEVKRDSTVVATSEATSYVDQTLAPGSSYRYAVVAIDRTGKRSAAANVTLTMPGTAFAGGAPISVTAFGSAVLDEPDVAVELSWQAATVSDGEIVGYMGRREGTLLTPDVAVLTYRDDTVEPGRSYRYTVVARDDDGNRGEAAAVEVFVPAQASVLNLDNQLDIVTYVLGLYAGKGYDPAILTGNDFVEDNEPVSEEILDSEVYARRFGYNCRGGGTAIVRVISRNSGLSLSLDQQYNACGWQGRIRDGSVSYSSEPYGQFGWVYDGFVLRDDGGNEVRVDGSIYRSFNFSKALYYDERRTDIARYSAAEEEGTMLLSDVDTTFGYGETDVGGPDGPGESAYLGRSLDLRAPWSGDATLAVTTPVNFVNRSDASRRFPIGRLEFRAGDGSALVLETDDGDANTVALRLTIGGETETQSHTWDRWLDVLTFDDADRN